MDPHRRERGERWELRVAGAGTLLAGRARMAGTFLQRAIGLLGRSHLEPGEGLVLPSCQSVHTCGMRFPIDVVFVDRGWRVVAVYEALPPWRMTRWVTAAQAVVELPAGTVRQAGLQVGNRLALFST